MGETTDYLGPLWKFIGGVGFLYVKVKRLLSVVVALAGLIMLSPLFAIIMIAIKLDSEGPVFFRQKRVGKGKKHFEIIKFRTMRVDAPKDSPTHLLDDPDRWITRVGRFLRKTSLDELPQLVNVLKGDMNIVGPRPALWNQFDLIAERDRYGANDVLPGLTGWAQVNGRDELPISIKARFDGEYVQNLTLWMDVKCLLRTVLALIRQDGIVEGRRQGLVGEVGTTGESSKR